MHLGKNKQTTTTPKHPIKTDGHNRQEYCILSRRLDWLFPFINFHCYCIIYLFIFPVYSSICATLLLLLLLLMFFVSVVSCLFSIKIEMLMKNNKINKFAFLCRQINFHSVSDLIHNHWHSCVLFNTICSFTIAFCEGQPPSSIFFLLQVVQLTA